jgi:AraC family transcriptional regulator, transcriptional activator of pobA
LNLRQDPNLENPLYHFSFLTDIKVYGVYYNSLKKYLGQYPSISKSHFHDFYSIIQFTGGKGTIRINHTDYQVSPQTIFLIAPDQLHSFEGLVDIEGTIFLFCKDFYVEEFSIIRLLDIFSYTTQINGNICNPSVNLTNGEFITITEITNSIGLEYYNCSRSNNSAIVIRSLLNIMLLKLSEFYEAKSGKSNKAERILIHKLSNLIDSYYIKEHHIGFYTAAFNISEKHMNDICNAHFNCGLKKILQDRLMQEARKLLLSTEMSVSEIAYKLNFEDNSYFNRVFRTKSKITPKKFRDLHRKFLP